MTETAAKSSKPYPLNLLILITLCSILLIIWYTTDHLLHRQTGDVHWYSADACELPDQTCSATLNAGRRLELTLHSDDPQPLKPLPVSVQLIGYSEAELAQLTLELDLQGRDMYMGYNRTQLVHQGNGLFNATPILSLCTDEVMVWRASVLIHPPEGFGKTYGSYFDFTVVQSLFR